MARRKKRSKKPQIKSDTLLQVKKETFLEAYARLGTIWHASEVAGINRQTHYDWLESDPAYGPLFEHAEGKAADSLEREARRRGMEGIDEPVIYQGEISGTFVDMAGHPVPKDSPTAEAFVPLTVKRYSDTLLIFLLKGARPEKYRDNFEVPFDGPKIQVNLLQFSIGNNSAAQIRAQALPAQFPAGHGQRNKAGGARVAPASWQR